MSGYRYTLTRHGLLGRGRLCWVMLNPSTADDCQDDPTIRRVRRFTEDNGYRCLVVVNLFAYRATSPRDLADPDTDIIGPGNRDAIRGAVSESDATVYAWGASIPHAVRGLAAGMQGFLNLIVGAPLCLGVTKSGNPRHPLYVRADQPLVGFRR